MSKEELLKSYQDKIIIFYKQHRRMPTYSELQKLTHYRSKGGVAKLVDKLELCSFLYRDRNGQLIPGFNFFSIPFPGTVQAGFPSPADEGHAESDRIDIYSFLVKNPQQTYVHRVTGDSMVDAGIYDGDLIISEITSDLPIGKIVIAEVNGSCTVKRLLKNKSGVIYLHAENPEFEDIYSDEGHDISVLAIVKSVIRQFENERNK